jgi:S1-C subfamily serine protease
MEVGAPVWAVGSPFGLSGSITFGILSGKHRLDLTGTSYDEQRIPRKDRHISARYSDLMQSDVAVNPGNSGGPLVNSRGELVGINTAIIGEAYRGVSFSIPSSIAKVVFEQILESGRMSRGWLGVELVRFTEWKREQAEQLALAIGSEPDEIEFDLAKEKAKEPVRGAVVRRIVSEDSPAAVAGLQPGDHIIQFNEKPVKGVEDLIFEISKSPVGSKIKLLIHRDGETQSMEVVIGERPAN